MHSHRNSYLLIYLNKHNKTEQLSWALDVNSLVTVSAIQVPAGSDCCNLAAGANTEMCLSPARFIITYFLTKNKNKKPNLKA